MALNESDSAAFLMVETSFPASISEPQIGVPIVWEQLGDGDWLTIKLDTTVVWQGIGTDFVPNTIQYAMIPSSGLAGTTRRMLFQLHSTGALNARVSLWDTPNPTVLSGPFPGSFTHTPLAGDGITGSTGDGGPASAARFVHPSAVVRDTAGNLYVADRDNHRVRRIDAENGDITNFAGTGTAGYSGDGGPAADAQLWSPTGLAFDLDGSLFIADRDNHRVRRVDGVSGHIATVAGNGTAGFTVDGVSATATQLNAPSGVAVDSLGNLFIADRDNHRVRRVQAGTNLISTVAGTFGWGAGPNGNATNSKLHAPEGIAIDGQDRVLIADTGNHQVRRVDTVTNQIVRLAGRQIPIPGSTGDGGSSVDASLNDPASVTVAGDGAIWIVERAGNLLRRIDPSGYIHSVVGTGARGFSSDLQSPAYDRLDAPSALALSGTALVVAEGEGHRIRTVSLERADLSVAMNALPERVDPGSTFQVAIQVSNSGPLDSGFTRLAASTSSHFKVLSSATNTGSCRASAPPECDLGILLPGAQATVVLDLEAVVAGIGQLNVLATGTRADLNAANGTLTATIRNAPDIIFANGFD